MPDTFSPEIRQKPLPLELRLPAVSLVAHAAEHRRPNGIMLDSLANTWFHALSTVYTEIPNPPEELINGIITRSLVIDYGVLGYCASHDRVVVSDLGCGFSTRYNRLRPCVEAWAHIDLPQVVRARCALGQMGPHELVFERDFCDLDLEQPFSAHRHPGSPALTNLFILEGVLNHLPRANAASLMAFLSRRYGGATVIGTVMTSRGQDGLRTLTDALGTPFPGWVIDSTSELEDWLKPAVIERVWFLGKVAARLGLLRPVKPDEASGFVFQAKL